MFFWKWAGRLPNPLVDYHVPIHKDWGGISQQTQARKVWGLLMMTVDVGDSVQTKIIKSLPVSRTVLSFRMITSDHKLEGMDDSGYDNQHHWYTCSSFARIDWFLSGLVQYQQQLSLLNHIVFLKVGCNHTSLVGYIYIHIIYMSLFSTTNMDGPTASNNHEWCISLLHNEGFVRHEAPAMLNPLSVQPAKARRDLSLAGHTTPYWAVS